MKPNMFQGITNKKLPLETVDIITHSAHTMYENIEVSLISYATSDFFLFIIRNIIWRSLEWVSSIAHHNIY